MKQPTISEVSAYWDETKLMGDPAEFFDHFEANGWMVGRVPMKNWQAAARNWSRNETKFGRNGDIRILRKSPETASREAEDCDRQALVQREAEREIAEIERLRKERGL